MKKFIPYGKQSIDKDDIKSVVDVLKSDYLTQGPKVGEFEQAICRYTGAKYCLAVANGTAALHLAILVLGVEKGREGITSPITFVASANCLVYAGIKPVFADIDPRTYNIGCAEIKKRTTAKTKVIVAVDFAGQSADLQKIYPWAKKKGIKVVEDGSHAIGSTFGNGSKVGSCKYSDLTTFSFHPVKTITTGEGGAVTTNDKKLYQKLLLLRSHGITKDEGELKTNPGPWYYEMQELGFNYRLTDLQATLGVSQLKKLNKFKVRRREIVARYNRAFRGLPDITTPYEGKDLKSAFHLYVVQIDFDKIGKSRAEVMTELKDAGIGTQVHYIPVHLQPYYRDKFGYKVGDYPEAERYYQKCLSLPLYPKMTDSQVDKVINAIKKI